MMEKVNIKLIKVNKISVNLIKYVSIFILSVNIIYFYFKIKGNNLECFFNCF